MAAARGKAGSRRRLLIYAAGAALLVVAFLWWRNRASSGTSQPVSSGTPGPDNASGAQQPNGGASNTAGQLPADLISHPDQLQQQVQTADTTTPESPQSIPQVTASQTPSAGAPYFSTPAAAPIIQTPQGQQYVQQQLAPPTFTVLGTQSGQQYVASIFTPPVSGGYVNAAPTAFAPAPAPVVGGNIITHGFVGD